MIADVFESGEMIRTVDFLLDDPGRAYNKSELAEGAGVSRPTLYKLLPRLEELGIVALAGNDEGVDLYKLDTDSPLVKSLVTFDSEVAKAMFRADISTLGANESETNQARSAFLEQASPWVELFRTALSRAEPSLLYAVCNTLPTDPVAVVCREKGKHVFDSVSA